MSIADTERRKRKLEWRAWCFENMVKAGHADEKTGACETIEDCNECAGCGHGTKGVKYRLKTGDPCPCCGQPIQTTDEETLELLTEIARQKPGYDWPAEAETVPVVRCKDCRYSIRVDEYELWCNGFCNPARLVRDVDYCSHGAEKRKEER